MWISDGTGNPNVGYWNHSYVPADVAEGGPVTGSLSNPYFGTRGQGTACMWPAIHLGTSNILFCDGHVKAQNLDVLFKGNSVAPLTVADD